MKINMKRKSKLLALIACAALVLSLSACGGGNKEAATTAPETTAEETTTAAETTTKEETTKETTTEAPKLDEIGNESKDAVSVELTNKTGQDIKSVVVATAETAETAENLLKEDDVFEKGETSVLYLAPAEAAASEEETAAEEAADEKLMTEEVIITLTLADDTELVLHGFPVENIKSGDIMVQDGIGYIVYENLDGEKNISTLTAEQAVAEAATAAPETEAPVVAEEPVYEEPVYEEPVYEEPAYVEPAGNDDACVGDGLTW